MNSQIWRRYRKTAETVACQMDHEFQVDTLEGVMVGHAGDYLCVGPAGERWPVRREIFEATYTQVEDIVELPEPPRMVPG